MTKPPELFAPDRPVRSDFARQRGVPYGVRRLITVIVVVGLVGGGAYRMWHRAPATPDEIPTVKAEGAYKQRPEQPGGIDIPHQDVQVYHEIDGSAANLNAKPVIEHLLPPPEEPNPASLHTTVSAPPAAMSGVPQVETLAPQVAAPETPTPASPANPSAPLQSSPPPIATTVVPPADNNGAVSVPAPPVSAPAVVPSVPGVNPPAKMVPPDVQSVADAPAVSGGTVVQVAATQDHAAAAVIAKTLQAKYAAVLGSAQLHPVYANLGAKGIYYRIQSQPLADTEAQRICAAVKSMNAGCILVRH